MDADTTKWIEKFENEHRARLEAETLLSDRVRTLYQTKAQLEEAQEELLRKERLATLGQFASSVGHELRNPLGVMSNAVYYLQTVLDLPPPDVSEYLGILRGELRVCEKIISDLLDFTRVKPSQRELLSVGELVDQQLARVEAPEGVRVDRSIPEDLPSVAVDPVQIGQVLINLMMNGYQAMAETGGVLTIRAYPDADRVRVEVEDTGPGVPEENREKIFEPLFTTKAKGIGLGLSVSRSLAEANDGRLSLSDPDEGGARFVLELPAAGEEDLVHAPPC